MNKIIIIGRLTKDPELKYTSSNIAVVNFTLAVTRDFKNAEGEYETDFIMCKCFRQRAEVINEYCKKGDLLGVEGRLQTGSYEKDGEKHYTSEIIVENIQFLASKPKTNEEEKNDAKEEKKVNDEEIYAEFGEITEISDEDIAF